LKGAPEEIIGAVHLFRKGIPENRGFWLAHQHWGRGIMTEALAPITAYAFGPLGFQRLVFANAVGNQRSRRVKEKAGARWLGTRTAQFVNPAYTEAEEWELLPP
jgi:[ribosomal protein S5]-alanine N-acetyltransferase